MAAVDQMAGYAAHLNLNTPPESKGRPVTEIAIFELQPEFAKDHPAAVSIFKSQIVANCKPGAPFAKGIRKIAWGFAIDDPAVFTWILDWDKIEDHWDFWLMPGFPPVIAAIEKLFEPGRPLVRHYDFGGVGMLSERCEVVRIMVWDDHAEGKREREASRRGNDKSDVSEYREGYAVDFNEATWWCSMLGYDGEDSAYAAAVNPGGDAVSQILRLEYQG